MKNMKVRITKGGKDSMGLPYWYNNKIGEVFKVKNWSTTEYITNEIYAIQISDCELVEEEKEDFKWAELKTGKVQKPEDLPDSLTFTHIEGSHEYKLNREKLGIVSASPDDIYLFDGLHFYRKDRIAVPTEEETKKYHSGVAEYNKMCDQIREELAADEPELDDDLKEITAHDEPKTMPSLNTDHFMRDFYDPMVKIKEKEFKEKMETWHQKAERETLEKINKGMEEFSRMNAPINGVYQFDKENLERLSKMQKPTESAPSEKIEITVDGNTYFINRKAWTLEKELRKYRNQLFEETISQDVYDLIIETLLP